jgi:hypothetical protein
MYVFDSNLVRYLLLADCGTNYWLRDITISFQCVLLINPSAVVNMFCARNVTVADIHAFFRFRTRFYDPMLRLFNDNSAATL